MLLHFLIYSRLGTGDVMLRTENTLTRGILLSVTAKLDLCTIFQFSSVGVIYFTFSTYFQLIDVVCQKQ